MKKFKIVVMLFALGVMGVTLTNCGGDDETAETCAQDEICDGKSVTSCCVSLTSCVYKYDGKEYQESEKDQLIDDLGCAAGSGARVAASEEREQLLSRLETLLQEAKQSLQ